MDAKQVNALLAQNIESYLAFLYGSNPAYQKGGIWNMGNSKGAQGDSLKIWDNGSFKDFASGEQGDLVTLGTLALSLSFSDTMRRLETYLGVAPDHATMADLDKAMAAIQQPTTPAKSKTATPAIVAGGQQWRVMPDINPWFSGDLPCPTGKPNTAWTYHTKDGQRLFLVGRWDQAPTRKKFFQIASYREEGWVAKAPDVSLWPLLDEPSLALYPKDKLTVLVEGEKAAEWGKRNLPMFFWTSLNGGAASVKIIDFISLSDRLVALWPDNDEPGTKAMEYIASQLPDALSVPLLPDWPDKCDVADLEPNVVKRALERLLEEGKQRPVMDTIAREEASRSISPDHTEPNQLGSVYRFLDRFGPDLKYLAEGKTWAFWDGRRWATDKGGYTWARGVETVEKAFNDALAWTFGDMKKLSRVDAYAQSAKSTSHIKGVIEGASLMPRIPVSETAFDTDADLLNCVNGVVDLRTGKLYPHAREKMMTKLVAHRYDPQAQAPMFHAFLLEIMCNDQELVTFLQIYFGYSLTGLPPDRIFAIFYGSGRNGKSTLIQIISSIMADYHVTIRSQSIMSGKEGDRPDRIGEDLIPLRGARLATMQESDRGTKLNEGKIKELTGRDIMRCRYLHSNLWLQFVNSAKMILTTNHRPRVTGQDPGIWDRIAMVEFGARIPEDRLDPDLSSKIIEQEAEGVLAWMIQGSIRFYQQGKKIVRPRAVIAATDDYRSDEDLLGKFVESCLTEAQQGRVKVSTLMEVYRKWMDASGDHNAMLGSRRFAEDIRPVMERYGYIRKKMADGTFYFGCSLLDDEALEARRAVREDLPAHWTDGRD